MANRVFEWRSKCGQSVVENAVIRVSTTRLDVCPTTGYATSVVDVRFFNASRVRAHTLYNDMNFAGSIISWPPNLWIKNILYNFAGDNACVGSLAFYAYAPYQHTALSY